MKKTVTNELVYFTAKEECIKDFSGSENSLDVDARFDFLRHYEKEARGWYDDAFLDKKAFSESEIDESMKNYSLSEPSVRKTIRFDKMTAFTAEKKRSIKTFSYTWVRR